MNNTPVKDPPKGAPPDQQPVEKTIDEVLTNGDKHRASVLLNISGGHAGEKFHLDIKLDSGGTMTCDMSCELSKRHIEPLQLTVEPEELAKVLTAFSPALKDDDSERQGGFPPCSLIGRLTVLIDDRQTVRYFMADPGQAETEGYKPPDYVQNTTEALYRFAERKTGIDNIRP